MKQVTPLVLSHAYDGVEDEMRHLFIAVYQKRLASRAADVNAYGMPHLGSKTLLQKYLVSQGISNFNAASLNEDYARYMVLAWRNRNPKRGTHFLNTFLRLVWGTEFDIFTLWQHKNKPYTKELKTEPEIEEDNESLDDYFPTCRLRVTLYGDSGYFSMEIAKSLNHILPARLFVQEVSRTISGKNTIYYAHSGSLTSLNVATVSDEVEPVNIKHQIGFGQQSSITSTLKGTVSDEQ